MSNGGKYDWLWIAGIGVAIGAVVYFSGRFFLNVIDSVHSWPLPDDLEKEIEYRKALASFLREALPEYSLIEEYGNERSRSDIAIGNSVEGMEQSFEKIAIELKYRLKNKAEVDRVIGQSIGYKQFGYEKTIIVSIDAEPNYEEVLKSRASVDILSGFLTLVSLKSNDLKQS